MNIKTNSKDVKTGDIFIALKGLNNDGNNYIDEALEKGAKYIISKDNINNTKEFLNTLLLNFNDLINSMILIGITGTNGKTTSSFLLYETLKKLNIKSAYIGTLGFYIDKKEKDLSNTTPDIITLYDLLIKCKTNDVNVVIMEVSSHALELDRVHGLKFDYVVFTNLTQDHLDFHNNMNDYLNAKKKLFDDNKNAFGIVNIDDKSSNNFNTSNTITFGFNNGDYKIISYKLSLKSTIYTFKYKNKTYKVKLNMPCKYNISLRKGIRYLQKATIPKGRMEVININKAYAIIDYAHTPDAVYNILKNVNEFKKGKIYTIIGCGGNRDKTKRKDMGSISTNYSDYVIFTSDNPRYENPLEILNDITNDLINTNYEIIENRKDAIKKGISLLKKNDILLILGKGHEEYQIINGTKFHFSDKEEVLKIKKA